MAAYETYETDATYDDMEGNASAERVKFFSCFISSIIYNAFSANDFV